MITTVLRLIILLFAIQTASAQSFNAELAGKLQSTLDSMVGMFANTKGMSASVYYPGQGIWVGASGLSHEGQEITPDMVFGLASNSKLYTAVAMLRLAEENILNLDDSLHRWLPACTNVNPEITVRQLLNHTSGISDPFFSTALLDSIKINPSRVWTANEVLKWLGPPLFQPGAGYGYSNINYVLAGMVAERAAGKRISEIIRQHLLTPLELDSTFCDIEEAVTGVIAHRWEDGADLHETSRISLNTSGGPAGSIFSTASEFAQWYHALMSGQVLDPASLAEMTTFGAPGNYGLGIAQFTFFGNICWGHGGSTIGYKSRAIYDPCMRAVVCGLSNSNPSAVDGITATLYKVLLDHLPACAANIMGESSVCQGRRGVRYSVPPVLNASSYVWDLPAGIHGSSDSSSITVDVDAAAASGIIAVRGRSAYGDGPVSSIAVTVRNTPATPVISRIGNVLRSSAAAGNQWYNGSGVIAGATDQDFVVQTDGSYYAIVTMDGCSSGSSNILTVVVSGIGNSGSAASFGLYPNPVTDELVIRFTDTVASQGYEIVNTLGVVVGRGWLYGGTIVNTAHLPAGLYMMRLGSGRQQKFLKR